MCAGCDPAPRKGIPATPKEPLRVAEAAEAGAGGTRSDVVAFDYPLVLGVGQSLCAGVAGRPPLTTTQTAGNATMWDPGPDPKFSLDGGADRLVFVPLVEPIRPELSVDAGYPRFAYPNNVKGETFHGAMANGISARAKALGLGEVHTVHANVCEGARSLADLRRGGKSNAYAAGLFETRAYVELSKAALRVPWVSAVVLTHGEADAENPQYANELATYFDELADDLRQITHQVRPITFFVSQQNAAPPRGRDKPLRPASSAETWHLSTVRPDVVCALPKYDFPYAKDRIHSTAVGYRRLGEKLAEAYVETIFFGRTFRPLEPLGATGSGNTVRVDFRVPFPPLGWDDTLGPAHASQRHPWAKGRGFEVSDETGDVGIAGVRIASDAVVLELTRATRGKATVRYAMTQDSDGPKGFRGSEADGRLGQLVDSDSFEGEDAETIEVLATRGSPVLDGPFGRHGRRDRVVGPGLPTGAVLVTSSATNGTLSSPYSGETGKLRVHVFSDMRNHAVMFELPVGAGTAP